MKNDKLAITCPKCGDLHEYSLDVRRSTILQYMTFKPDSPAIQRRFTRLFPSPVKEADYEITIMLVETSHTKIESVEVKGIVKEDHDGDNQT